MKLLNKGLNFAVPNGKIPIRDIIVDVELALGNIQPDKSKIVRDAVKLALKKTKTNKSNFADSMNINKAVKSLNKKDIFATKADKENAVVILDTSIYDSNIQLMIDNGPYKRVRKPLKK